MAHGLHSMWDLPIPGIIPASPALAGGVFTTEPPGNILDSSFPHMYLSGERGRDQEAWQLGILSHSSGCAIKGSGAFGERLNFPGTVSSPQKCAAVGL